MSASDPSCTTIGNPAGAFLVVPDIAQDDPLGPVDLPLGDKPAIVGGIDYTRLAVAYLDTIAGTPDARVRLPDLAALSRTAENSRMDFLARLLIDHDTKAHHAAGFTRFEEYYSRAVRKTVRWPTIRRQISEIKVALVLAANGFAILPSQARSYALCQTIPRKHWIPFWRHACELRADGKIGEKAFARELERYLDDNDLSSVGERADCNSRRHGISAKTYSRGHDGDCGIQEPPPQPSRKEREKILLHQIDPLLAGLFSTAGLRMAQPRKQPGLPRRWIAAVKKTTRRKVNFKKLFNWLSLRAFIAEHLPELDAQLEYQLYCNLQSAIESQLARPTTDEKNFRARKKSL